MTGEPSPESRTFRHANKAMERTVERGALFVDQIETMRP